MLREECINLRHATKNPLALRVLDKLVKICDEDLQWELAICLLCV